MKNSIRKILAYSSFVLALNTFAAAFAIAEPARPMPSAATVAAFYNPKVSDRKFLARVDARSSRELQRTLRLLYQTGPSEIFKKVGEVADFDLTPAEYGVKHAINYYIPKTYVTNGHTPVLVILHGGGASTNTYESARDVSVSYLSLFTQFAEKNGVVLLAPSSSLGWSFITRILVSRTIDLAKQELAVDPDRIYVWGHSMGGMGITRESHWLMSQVAAFMPNAAGMQDEFRGEPILKTYFDGRFIHSQGLQDSFQVFVERTRDVEARMKALETELGVNSGYRVMWEDRDHNMDMGTVVSLLEDDVLKGSRDKYRNSIHPIVGRVDTKSNHLGPDVDGYAITQYQWIETRNLKNELPRKEFDQGLKENLVAFSATAFKNVYDIRIDDPRIKNIRVLISAKMANLAKPVIIKVNGRSRFNGMVSPDNEHMLEIARARRDRTYIFDNYVDIALR